MKLKALDKKLVCKAVTIEKVSKGGIIIPDIVKRDEAVYEVVSKGSDAHVDICVGDKVIVSGYQGFECEEDGVKYKVFEDSQVMAVIDDES